MINNELLDPTKDNVLTDNSLIKIGERYYQTKILFPLNFKIENGDDLFTLRDGLSLNPDIVYLIGDYYYFYRGKISDLKGFSKLEPGIYYDDTRCMYMIKTPESDEEKTAYIYNDKITSRDAEYIRNAVLNHEVVIFNVPDTSHSQIPDEIPEDDILKKLIKRAIKDKGIDLDQYKIRFASKNMLFNTKQVLRGSNKLSILLFDRCAEALNLKYTIILEEGGGEVIGYPLKDKIVISSDDVYNANMIPPNKSDND